MNHPKPLTVRHWLALIAATFLAGVAMTGCGQTSDGTRSATAGLPDLRQSLMAHQWLLEETTKPVTLAFDGEGAASGSAQCNTYRAKVELSGDDGVEFGAIASTKRACEPDLMRAEAEYLADLAKVRTADVTDRNRLVLEGDGVRLEYATLDYSEAIIGEWTIVNLRKGDAVTGPLDGTTPTATFDEDHRLVVSTGCNSLRSGWSLDGRTLTIDPPAQTMMACDDPAGVMDQEAALGAALPDAATVEITPSTLTILDESGSILILATKG